MYSRIGSFFAALVLATSLGFAGAANSTPVFDFFGPLPQATFGGSGIPNDPVAVRVFEAEGLTITLGLAATPRFSNPNPTNDGAGTFFAQPGSNFGGAGESMTEGALWNFSYFMSIEGGATFADFDFKVLYDFDPGANTPEANLGVIDINAGIIFNDGITPGNPGAVTLVEDSQNLNFNFLSASFLNIIIPPTGITSFDPNAAGEFSFILTVAETGLPEFARAAIDVQVGVVPLPAALPLYGTGLALMGFIGWRRRKAATA